MSWDSSPKKHPTSRDARLLLKRSKGAIHWNISVLVRYKLNPSWVIFFSWIDLSGQSPKKTPRSTFFTWFIILENSLCNTLKTEFVFAKVLLKWRCLPSLTLTASLHLKCMLRIRSFPFGMAYVQGRNVSFRECILILCWTTSIVPIWEQFHQSVQHVDHCIAWFLVTNEHFIHNQCP